MHVLAIDFGTSTTVAALSSDGGPGRLVTIDGSSLMPSAVFLTDGGTLAVGRDAERQSRLDPTRYEPNPKRRIDDGEVLLGAAAVPVAEVISEVLRHVGAEVRRQIGGPPDQLRLTHPARWGSARREILVEAAVTAGLVTPGTRPILIPEPVAAATHFAAGSTGQSVPSGGALAVYDLGAGTFDVAVLRRTGAGWEVLAEAGLPNLGGLDFEQAIIEHVSLTAGVEHPDDWERLIHPPDPTARRLARAFAQDVKDAKESLSRFSQTNVAMPPPFQDVHLTRAGLEELIRNQLERSTELLAAQVERAGLTADQLVGVYLVGGSSRIPLIRELTERRLGTAPSTLEEPETSVASGALLVEVTADQVPAVPPPGTGPHAAQPGTGAYVAMPPGTGAHPVRFPASGSVPLQTPIHPGTGSQPTYPSTGGFQVAAGTGAYPSRPPARGGPGGPPFPGQQQGQQQGRPPEPGAGRRTPVLIALAAALVAVLVVGGFLIFSSGDDPAPEAQDSAAPTSAADESPTASFDPNAAPPTTTSQDQKDWYEFFADSAPYFEQIYSEFTSCTYNFTTRRSTGCDLANGLLVACSPMDAGEFPLFEHAFSEDNSQWFMKPGSYQEGTWESDDGQHGGKSRAWINIGEAGDKNNGMVYWERDDEVACAMSVPNGSPAVVTLDEVQQVWTTLFKR